jgi:hypothetical protein
MANLADKIALVAGASRGMGRAARNGRTRVKGCVARYPQLFTRSNDGFGSRLCENSARYNRTRNFEAYGHAQSKKTQKFILRSALRPNQISFSHSLGHERRIRANLPAAGRPRTGTPSVPTCRGSAALFSAPSGDPVPTHRRPLHRHRLWRAVLHLWEALGSCSPWGSARRR